MSYMCKRMRFRNAIEVYEYHTAKYGAPGQERQGEKESHSGTDGKEEQMQQGEVGKVEDPEQF